MTDPLNREDAIGWVQRSLGCGAVILEVTEEHSEDAFDDALRWWIARKGIKRHAVLAVYSGESSYEMPTDCDEVMAVWFPGVQLDVIASINPFAFIDVEMLPVAYQSLTGLPGGSFYGTLHQMIAHAETARRVIGAEPAFEYDKDTNLLQIYPTNHTSGTVIARYASQKLITVDPTPPATTPKNDFANLRFRDRDLILRYARAALKVRLGRVRSKYTEWPSAGGAKTMDGDTLLTEGREEFDTLTEELIGLSDPVPFVVG